MTLRRAWYVAVLLLYLLFTCYQLGLPGLHYDEAKEAGVNAMEILTGAPVTAFRSAGIMAGGRLFPLMVQDYIGALNVYLALPLLGLSGIGVPNLRLLPVLTGLIGLIVVERTVSEWIMFSPRSAGEHAPERRRRPAPVTRSGLVAIILLAASPSYVFWARQGIFVTNLMVPFVFLCFWQGLAWLRTGRTASLLIAALAGGLALYAKLLAVWVIAPFVCLAAGYWLMQHRRDPERTPALTWSSALGTVIAFVAPLLPLVFFNLQSGGTLASVGGNLRQSYYGVNNANVLGNLPVRWGEIIQVLRGEQFWYLGGSYANILAPWFAAVALAAGLWRNWRRALPPLLLLLAAFVLSLFTLSDLFITHYVLLQPLLIAAVAIALGCWLDDDKVTGGQGDESVSVSSSHRQPLTRSPAHRVTMSPCHLVLLLLILWLAFDLTNTVRYHMALAATGGLGDHSDASYHLAYHLRYNGMGAPIALDWGIDAPVRYLTQGTVTPIEIFGYGSPAAPDDGFGERLAPFLDNPDNRYILHAPSADVFHGRRAAFLAAVNALGGHATVEQQFSERNGAPLYQIWRVDR